MPRPLDPSTCGLFRDRTLPKPADRHSWCHWLTTLQFQGCTEDQCWDTGPKRTTVSGQRASMIVAGPKIACGGTGISKLRLGQQRNRMPLHSTCIWHCCTGNGKDKPKCPQEIGSRIRVVWLSGGFACHQTRMSGRFYDAPWVKCHFGSEGWISLKMKSQSKPCFPAIPMEWFSS